MLQPDQILHDRYHLKQLLGKTAGRQTWLAEDQTVQPAETVVVKLLLFGDQVQWDDLKLFEREAQVLRQLNHPQIPKYRDFFSVDDRLLWFCLVQDYIPGNSIKALLAEGKRFTEKQVRQIAVNLLHLLSYLHELSPPVLHRDVKPSNLILGEDGFIYLVDFGAVQDRAATEGATFTVVGTYGYAPLEQFGGRAVPASDLYALGATLIHLLTGVSPAELPQKELRIQFADRVSLDPAFVRWIERLVAPDVAQRFQTAQEALERLRSPQKLETTQSNLPAWQSPYATDERSLSQPYDTRIEVYETNSTLLIKIPSKHVVLTTILLGGIVTMAGLISLAIESVFPIVIALLATLFIWQEELPTFVQFEATEFAIYKKIFGQAMTLGRGDTTNIRSIFHTIKTIRRGRHTSQERYVVIQTNYGEDVFGKQLSWEEGDWLVGVIQRWLRRQ